MIKKIIVVFICILMISCTTTTFALTPSSKSEQQKKNLLFDTIPIPLPASSGWIKTFGGKDYEEGDSVQQTTDGGYIIAGFTESFGSGGGDVWLIKTDSDGNEIWNRRFGGIYYDKGFSVHQTSDSGYILTGETKSFGAGNGDVWLIKTDANGYMTWDRTFGGPYYDSGWSVQQTFDGGYIIAGFTTSFGEGGEDVWLIKTDSNGYMTWDRTFGGPYSDIGWSVQQTTDGGYIITGATDAWGVISLVWLIKTDDAGNKIWDKNLGRTDYNCFGCWVHQTTDGGYIITGVAGKWGGNGNVLLIKTNSDGNETWNRTFGGMNPSWGWSVQQTSDGGYIITGWIDSFITGNDIWLIKTDSIGNMIWDRTFGGTDIDWGWSVQQTNDGGYIITGMIGYGSNTSADVCLIKTDSQGKLKTKSFVNIWFEKLFQRFPFFEKILKQNL